MEQSMGSATTTNTPAEQVDDLIKAVADEAGLEISAQLASVPTGITILFNHFDPSKDNVNENIWELKNRNFSTTR